MHRSGEVEVPCGAGSVCACEACKQQCRSELADASMATAVHVRQAIVETEHKSKGKNREREDGLTGSASRKRGELYEVHGGGDSSEKILAEGKKSTVSPPAASRASPCCR